MAAAILLLTAACGGPMRDGPSPEAYARVRDAAESRYVQGPLTDALKRITAWLEPRAPEAVSLLQPGLSNEQIDAAVRTSGFEYSLPTEVRELYRWRNGSRSGTDVPFVGGHRLLSLQEALAAATGSEVRDLFRMPAGALPILAFQEEYFYVVCESRTRRALPVLFRLLEDPTADLRFTSVSALFQTWAAAQAAGGVALHDEVPLQMRDPEVWKREHARLNPELAR